MGHRQRLKDSSEYDWIVKKVRAYYVYLKRAGVGKKIKNGLAKRARQEAKRDLVQRIYDEEE